MQRRVGSLAVLISLAIACAEVDIVDGDSGAATSSAHSSSTGGDPGDGGGGGLGSGGGSSIPESCTPTPPVEGAACAPFHALCTYGSALEAQCRDRYLCESTGWIRVEKAHFCDGEACPIDPPADESPCESTFLVCGYEDGTHCGCERVWTCYAPPPGPNCPQLLPNAGAPCSEPATCPYGDTGFCGWGLTAVCTGTAWRWDAVCTE
jgi:hypothetical protein